MVNLLLISSFLFQNNLIVLKKSTSAYSQFYSGIKNIYQQVAMWQMIFMNLYKIQIICDILLLDLYNLTTSLVKCLATLTT